MINIYFDKMHSCTLTITNGEFFYDFVDDLNEDGRNIVVDTCQRMETIIRLVYSFNDLDTNQFDVRLDSSAWRPTLYVSGIREYLCAFMIMLSNAPGWNLTMNFSLSHGNEVKVLCLK